MKFSLSKYSIDAVIKLGEKIIYNNHYILKIIDRVQQPCPYQNQFCNGVRYIVDLEEINSDFKEGGAIFCFGTPHGLTSECMSDGAMLYHDWIDDDQNLPIRRLELIRDSGVKNKCHNEKIPEVSVVYEVII